MTEGSCLQLVSRSDNFIRMRTITFLSFVLFLSFAQQAVSQKIGYMDSGFILSKMPEFKQAQEQVDQLSKEWQAELDALNAEIDKDFSEFKAEEVLLTDEMRKEKIEAITKKKVQLAENQKKYFGYEGLLFLKRQELVKPIQDKIFEAVEKISRTKRIDIMFDKSSDLVMIYTNPVHDYTDYILEELGLVEDSEEEATNK